MSNREAVASKPAVDSWCFVAYPATVPTPKYCAMPPFRKEAHIRQRATLLFESHWRPDAVAQDARASRATGYRWARNLAVYGDTVIPPHLYTHGPSHLLSPVVLEALIEYHRRKPYLFQDELARFLAEEWDICVHRSTISRALKAAGISRKKGQRIGDNQSEILRIAWQAFASEVLAE